jgi:molybdate transport repressor ModE-like protein
MKLLLKTKWWVGTDQGKSLDDGKIELLGFIRKHCSVSEASSAINMVYLDSLSLCQSRNEYSFKSLLIHRIEGERTQDTDEGKRAILIYRKLKQNLERQSATLNDLLERL